MAADSGELERLLTDRVGIDPLSVGSPLILRAARQRMKELGLDDISAYVRLVQQSGSELQSLIEEVVVSESWFFRDARPYEWFRKYVHDRWAADPLRPTLRILSLACASGEEPYSIAMTLRDLGLPTRRYQIDAVEISARQLAIARRGVYSSNAFRSSDLSFRARYFCEHPQGHELHSSIRSAVRFFQATVLAPDLLEGCGPYDVIFCRNLLIYLEPSARTRVLAVIERLLTADGLLLIGHADRLEMSGVEPKFIAVEDPACFVYRLRSKGDASGPRPVHQLVAPGPVAALATPVSVSSHSPGVLPLAGHRIATASDQRSEAAISSSPVSEQPLLDQAADLANKGRFAEAIIVCERQLQLKGFSPAAYYLMGVIFQAAGNRSRAEECLHKAVYLDPTHDEALLALALLAERRGDHDTANGFRRRAERSVTKSAKRVH
jgi:chemotaxis protein methyltransferase WspC